MLGYCWGFGGRSVLLLSLGLLRHFVVKPHIFQLFDSVLIGYTPIQNSPPGVALSMKAFPHVLTLELLFLEII
jgi:hypothetical protein